MPMTNPRRLSRTAAGWALTLFFAAAGRSPCCFTNPQYAGPCAVQPGKGETCSSILAYLNNPGSQGKSYCSNTNIRGGWKSAKCTSSHPEASKGAGDPARPSASGTK
jgi:hypothetical protein